MWGEDNLMPGVTLADIDRAAGVYGTYEPDPDEGWWYDDEWGCWRLLDADADDETEMDEDDGGDAA